MNNFKSIFFLTFIIASCNYENNFIGSWGCGCYSDNDQYTEMEIADSIYWLTTEFIGPNPAVEIITTIKSPDSYFLKSDTLFRSNNWYLTKLNKDTLLINSEWKCWRIFPKIKITEWSKTNDSIFDVQYLERKKKTNCP